MFEIKKLELQKMKVSCAMAEMEFKILEREQDIERLKENIAIQKDAVDNLEKQIKTLNKEV